MPLALEVVVWLILASIMLALAGFIGLPLFRAARGLARAWGGHGNGRPVTTYGHGPYPSVIRSSDPTAVAFIWFSLFALVPLLALALWSLSVEMSARRLGPGLVLAIVHVFLLWRLTHIGTQVQRHVEISRTGVIADPVIGRRRQLPWASVARVEDVSYVGPGVSGLYLYEHDGPPLVLDTWLPGREEIRTIVFELAPYAQWARKRRGFLIG